MDRTKRPARLLGLVLFLPLAVTGCRTIVPTKPAASPSAPPSPQEAARPSLQNNTPGALAKNDFHGKPTVDQRFNIHIELGKQYMREQQFEPALAEFKKALEACSQTSGLRGGSHRTEQQALAHRKIGAALASRGRFGDAEDHMKQATKLAPNDPRVWNDFGRVYGLQSKFADAEQCLKRAMKLDPDSPLVRQNLGLMVAYQGRSAEGLDLMTQAGGTAAAHVNLGYVLACQGRSVEAREEYRKALETEPKLTKAHEALARLDNPKSPEPLGALTANQATIAPTAADPSSPVVAIPAPTPLSVPTAVASAAPAPIVPAQPRAAAVSEVKLQAPQVMGAQRTAPAASTIDGGLRPTSYGGSPVARSVPAAPAVAKPATAVTAPAPVKAGTPARPVSAPVATRLIPPIRPAAPATSAAAPAVPAAKSQVDVELRPTSYRAVATAKAVPPVSAPVRAATPQPIKPVPRAVPTPAPAPAKAATPPAAVSTLFPPPIPARVEMAAGSVGTKPSAIPAPVPVSSHVAAPTLERVGDPTSLPAADAQLVRLPSAS